MHKKRLVALAALLAACGPDTTLPPPTGETFGSIHTSWTIVNGAGEARSCDSASVRSVALSIGGGTVDVPCADGEHDFTGLLPGRYPVIAKSKSTLTVLETLAVNATVAAGAITQVPFRFLVDPTAGGRGSIHLRWTVDGQNPALSCGAAHGETVHLVADDGSVETFDQSVPCRAGEATISDLKLGIYVPKLILEDLLGTRITSSLGEAVSVQANQTAEPRSINIVTRTDPPAQLRAEWTINSSAAAAACPTVAGGSVRFLTVVAPPRVPTSTTVPCARGFAVLVGLSPEPHDFRLSLEYGGASSTSTVVRDLRVPPGQTSTITYDFRTE